jgi:exodeoxyribonuclease VII small subunit
VSAPDPEPVSFDRALAELDRIVARMEQGDVGLEEAVALFEEGQRHLATCRERLAAAQRRIEELTADDLPQGDEEPEAEPF